MARYKAVLCDDDEIITQGLTKLIPWERLDIQLCGCAYDGLQAEKLVERYQPDILVSDIRMPFLDGLELTRRAKENNPHIKVIIISGYDDFQYAQNALKVGAMDYILKPVDEQGLITQLRRAVAECRSREQQDSMQKENWEYQQVEVFKTLIYKGMDAVRSQFGDDLLADLPPAACAVFLVAIDDFEHMAFRMTEEERRTVNEVFFRCVQQQLGEGVTLFEQQLGSVGCYVLADTPAEVKARSDATIANIRNAFQKAGQDYTITFACSNRYESIQRLRDAYDEAASTLRGRFIYPAGSVLYYSQAVGSEDPKELKDFEGILAEFDFVFLIKQGNKAAIDAQLDKLQRELTAIGARSYLFMKIITGNIYARLLKELHELGISEEDLGFSMLEEYQRSAEPETMETAIGQLRRSIHKIADALEKNNNRHGRMMAKANKYIEDHYMDHTLSLDDVAQHVHMSPSYFSVIFKAEQGAAFTDYLIHMRIEKSKEYMKHTDLKVFEIAYKVGYDTAAYFSAAFKKATGQSPTEYREDLKREG